MPRKPAIVPNTHIHTTLPPNLATKLELHLYSELEERVPRGAMQAFLVARIAEYFDRTTVDLAPYMNTLPNEVVISGHPHSVDKLIHHLKGGSSNVTIP